MNPLTLQHAIENNFTAVDCVRYFKPDWTDEECDFHLWEFTCYPFSMEVMIEQLNKYFLKLKKSNRTLKGNINQTNKCSGVVRYALAL